MDTQKRNGRVFHFNRSAERYVRPDQLYTCYTLWLKCGAMLEHFSTIICTGLFTRGLLILFWLYLNSKWQENQILGKPWSVSFVLSYRKSYNPLGLHLLGSQMRYLFKGWLLLCKLTNLSCRWESISKNRKLLRLPCNWGRDKFSEQPKQSQIGLGLTVRLGNSL